MTPRRRSLKSDAAAAVKQTLRYLILVKNGRLPLSHKKTTEETDITMLSDDLLHEEMEGFTIRKSPSAAPVGLYVTPYHRV